MVIQHDVAVFLAGGEVREHRSSQRVLRRGAGRCAVDLQSRIELFRAEEEHITDVLLFQLTVIVDEVSITSLTAGRGTASLARLSFPVLASRRLALVFRHYHFLTVPSA